MPAIDFGTAREIGQIALGAGGILMGTAAFARPIWLDRPRVEATCHRGMIVTGDFNNVMFVKVFYELTNHSRLPNSVSRFWLNITLEDGSVAHCEPAIYQVTADRQRWFYQGRRDRGKRAGGPIVTAPDYPTKPINMPAGETVSFEVAFDVDFYLSAQAARTVPMSAQIGPRKGSELHCPLAPISNLMLRRMASDGERDISFSDGEGNDVAPDDLDFERTMFGRPVVGERY